MARRRAAAPGAAILILGPPDSGSRQAGAACDRMRPKPIAGFACHFFAEGSFRWLRDRFVSLPPIAQGGVLACAALVLRELGQPKLVPFIYFQF